MNAQKLLMWITIFTTCALLTAIGFAWVGLDAYQSDGVQTNANPFN